jgi:outer membrane lipase/esterase
MSGRRLGLAALALALVSTSALAQQRYVAFGDSLSDNGNFFAATGQPPAPYFNGRFSNGPTWVELLAGAPMAGFFPAAPVNNALSTNFAFGGARTDNGPGSPTAPNISGGTGAQISSYLARGGTFGPTDTVTMWAGANNIFQGLPVAAANPLTAQATMQGIAAAAAGNVATQVGQIAGAGARQIIVMNLPSFASVPEFAGGPASALAGFSTSVFNGVLSSSIATVAAANPGANITSVDVASVFSALQANPAAFGFGNATASCIATLACVANPAARDQYAFWDGVHPTAAGHRLIASVLGQYMVAPALSAAYAVLGETAIDDRRVGLSRAFDRLDSARLGTPGVNTYFINLYGSTATGDGNGSRLSFRSSSYGVNFGMDRAITSAVAVTASGSIGLGSLRAGGVLSADSFNAAFDIGASYSSGVFFAKAGVGLGVTQYNGMERQTVAPLVNRVTNTAAVAYNAGIEVGTRHMAGMFEISPRARLAWIGGNVGAINEDGVIAPLSLRSQSPSALLAGAELRATAHLVNTPTQRTSVTALIGYERYLAYSGNALSARLIGNTAQGFRTAVSDPKGPGVVLGLGLSSQLGGAWTISADYRASIGERSLVRHSGQIGVRASF